MTDTPATTPTAPRPSFVARSISWLVHQLWLPLTTTALGLAFAGGRLALGHPEVGTAEFLTRWGLFGLAYGFLVMALRVPEEFGFGNRWTALLAPALALGFAWQCGHWFFSDITVIQMFLVAAIASIVITPLLIYLWHLFFE